MLTKETFLTEHNRLSPVNLQVTINTLIQFREEKPMLFKGDEWPIDKIRRPFILWLTSLTEAKKEELRKVNRKK